MKRAGMAGLALLLLLCGCSREIENAGDRRTAPAGAPLGLFSEQQAPSRFIAVSHRLELETSQDTLAKAWQATAELCRSLRCEILSSSINNRTADAPPAASLALRIAPEDLQKLFDQINKSGSLLQHVTDSQDKTAAVIDVEARLRNMTQFRDRLRGMLGTRSSGVKELIEIERELARVQAELDSLAAQRKVLANETEKVAVHIDFSARRSAVGRGVLSPIARAWRNSAYVLSESAGALLTFVVAVIPWLLLAVPLLWLAARLLRRLLRRRASERDV